MFVYTKGMNDVQTNTKVKGRQTSFRNISLLDTLESSHQKSSQLTVSHIRHSQALPVQSAGGFENENDHQREDVSDHGESHQQLEGDSECPQVSTTTGEACSSTDQPADDAFVSLQRYSDFVVMVPTPRTSSPIEEREPTSSRLQTDVSANLELQQGCGEANHESRNLTGRQGSNNMERNRGSSQLQKTVGRLKRYFGLAAACGTSSESRQDDVSFASKEARFRPPPAADHEEIETIDVDRLSARRRTLSHSDSLDTAAVVVGGHRVLRPDHTGICPINRQADKFKSSVRGELKSKQPHVLAPPVSAEQKSQHGVKVSVDDLAVATVVPGVRVRVPPRRQLSNHERPLADSSHMAVGTTQTGSWVDDAHVRSRANVERWLCQNSKADTGRLCSIMTGQPLQLHRRSVQRASHAFRSRPRISEAPDLSKMERSVSETDVRQPTAVDHFRARDQHRITPNRSAVPRTPSVAGSTGVEGESRLGPSLVQLVAEIIEGLEQRSRDDSSAVWSGVRGAGTPASKIFQQFTTQVRNTDLAVRNRTTIDDRRPEDTAGQRGSAGSCGGALTEQDKTRNNDTNEALSEKTLTGRRENLSKVAATESEEKSSGIVPSCSVAVLRQRLLRAVEGSSSRRPVTERSSQRRGTGDKKTETETGNFQSSASVNCSTGDLLMCMCV